MTTLTTRFNHLFYGDDVINLSLIDLLDTQLTGQMAVNAARTATSRSLEVPFVFTPDLQLFMVITPRHELGDHLLTLPRMRFDVTNALSSTSATQSIRLCGCWNAISEIEFSTAVDALSCRFPTFETTVGSFQHYQSLPLMIYKLRTEHILLMDEAMFGPERIAVEVLRVKQPSLSLTSISAPALVPAAC